LGPPAPGRGPRRTALAGRAPPGAGIRPGPTYIAARSERSSCGRRRDPARWARCCRPTRWA